MVGSTNRLAGMVGNPGVMSQGLALAANTVSVGTGIVAEGVGKSVRPNDGSLGRLLPPQPAMPSAANNVIERNATRTLVPNQPARLG